MIAASSPLASMIVVASFPTVILLAEPNHLTSNFSKRIPLSVDTTVPPVRVAISSKIAFLRSPKSGAFTATTGRIPLILLTTIVESASPSISSAITNSDLFCCDTPSKIGSSSLIEDKRLSVIRINGF